MLKLAHDPNNLGFERAGLLCGRLSGARGNNCGLAGVVGGGGSLGSVGDPFETDFDPTDAADKYFDFGAVYFCHQRIIDNADEPAGSWL